MPYVRVSLMRPRAGDDAAARGLIDELVEFYRQQPGYLTGYRLEPADHSALIGRLGVWASEADANAAAQQEHDLALRARLNAVTTDHNEYSFEGIEEARV